MKKIILFAFLLALSSPAFAQDRAVPGSRADVTLSFSPLVKKAAPAVVNIYTKRVVTRRVSPFMGDPLFNHFFGGDFGGGLMRQRVESALGSGVIVESDGLVVTNAHVVKDAEEITVVLPDGREFAAQKALTDEPSDLALLRIDTKGERLPFITLEPSEGKEVGDLVLAIGNPFGVGQTVTSGIISALARSSLDISDFNFFIQTDAAVNPGNSGGALVSMDGGLIGINTAIYSRDGGSLGIGFAIPSEMVATVIAAEKSGQTGERGVLRPWLGVTAQKVTADIADSLGLKTPHGVLMANLHKASPARKAGLNPGDIVLAVNGKDVREPADMKFRMATTALGESAEFKVLSKGREKTIRVAAVAPPEDPPRSETVLSGYHPFDGVKVANVNPALANELGLSEEEGVAVIALARGSAAARFMRPGEIIAAVNGRSVTDVAMLQKIIRGAAGTQGWELVISSGGQKRQVLVR